MSIKISFRKILSIIILLQIVTQQLLTAQTKIGKYAFDGGVNCIVSSSDGSTYIGGAFNSVGAYIGNGVKFNTTNGSFNNNDVQIDGTVYAVIRIPSAQGGGWYIGGDFTKVGGINRNRLARITNQGALDLSFSPNINNTVLSLALDGAGNLYVGGDFTSVNSTTRNRLAKFSPVGVLDNTFAPDFNSSVRALATDMFDNLYVGGSFNGFGSWVPRSKLAKFDASGALASFNPNVNGSVYSMIVDASNNLYIGGLFSAVGGATRNRLAKFNGAGILNGFNPDVSAGVYAFALDGANNLYIGGFFTTVDGQSRNHIAKFNSAGVLNTTFKPNINLVVNALDVDASNNVYAGGAFTFISSGGATRNRLAKFSSSGTLDTQFNPNMNGTVNALAMDVSGNVYVGGDFTAVNTVDRRRLAKITANGDIDPFNPNMSSNVNAMVLDADDNLYVGGYFTSVGPNLSTSRKYLAKYNAAGFIDGMFNPDLNQAVFALAIDSLENIYAGGSFTNVGGQSRNCIAKFSKTGLLEPNFAPNINASVQTITTDSSNNVYVGGYFNMVDTIGRNYLAKFNPSGVLDTIFNPNPDAAVFALLADSSNNLYVGGGFSIIGGQFRNYMAKLNQQGSMNLLFNPYINDDVYEIETNDFSNFYIGGAFTSVGGYNRKYTAKIDTQGVLDINFETELDDVVYALEIDQWNTLHVGGNFSNKYNQYCLSSTPSTVINTQPMDSSVCAGNTVSFSLDATGFRLTYQWKQEGTNIGTNSNILSISNVSSIDTGAYYCVVSSACYIDTSGGGFLYVNEVDTSITVSGLTLMSNAIGANYQWVDCNNGNAPIQGETNASFSPTVNGDYAVEVTENGCTALSSCKNIVVSTVDKTNENSKKGILLYPNPTSEKVTINALEKIEGGRVILVNNSGQCIKTVVLASFPFTLDLSSYPNGVYYVQIVTNSTILNKAVVKY